MFGNGVPQGAVMEPFWKYEKFRSSLTDWQADSTLLSTLYQLASRI